MYSLAILLQLLPFALSAPNPQPVAPLKPLFTSPPKLSGPGHYYLDIPPGTASNYFPTGTATYYTGIAPPAPTGSGGGSYGGSSTSPTDSPFSITAVNGANQIFDTVVALDGKFWTGRKQGSFCPQSVGEMCEQFNGTETKLDLADGGLSLDVAVPGGQEVYVAADGALSFLQAHNHEIPKGAKTSGFASTGNADNGTLTFHGKGFMLCEDPVFEKKQVRQLFVRGPKKSGRDCVDVNASQQYSTAEGEGANVYQYQ